MAIPTHKEIRPELLKLASQKGIFKTKDIVDELADVFNLTEEERLRYYDSQNGNIFYSRVMWAKSGLYRSGLLDMVGRGTFKISDKGIEISRLDSIALAEHVESNYKASKRKKNSTESTRPDEDDLSDSTPTEMMQEGYKQIKENLKNDLLEKIKEMSPMFFEGLVVKLLKNMGYGDPVKGEWEVTKGSNDEGIDGIIKEDALGLEVIYIQAKRWSGGVGRPEIQKFAGALLGKSAKKGVFITTSDYSSGAIEYAKNLDAKIVLINGSDLAEYMVDYNVGVSHVNTFEIKALDTDFFEE